MKLAWIIEDRFKFGSHMAAVVSALLILSVSSADGTDYTWQGGTTTTWSQYPTNWSPAGIPGALDRAMFPPIGFGGVYIFGNEAIHDMTFSGNNYSFLGGGTLTLGGGLASTITVDDQTSQNTTATVSVRVAGNVQNIYKLGPDTLRLNAPNTFSSVMNVNAGTLRVEHPLGLGSAADGTIVGANSTLGLAGGNFVGVTIVDEPLQISGLGYAGGGSLRNVSGDNGYNGNLTVSSSSRISAASGTLSLDPPSGNAITGNDFDVDFDTTFGSSIFVKKPISIGSGGVSKNGAGRLVLDAVNIYSGVTMVDDGVLEVNGSVGTTVVNIGGKLTGNGALGSLTVAGGSVAPGNGVGTLTSGNVLFNSSSTLEIEINGVAPQFDYDQFVVNGSLDLSDCALTISLGFTPQFGDAFVLLVNDSSDSILGTFAGLPEASTLTIDDTVFRISYVGGNNNDVVLSVIPEPNSAALMVMSTCGVVVLRRRNTRNV